MKATVETAANLLARPTSVTSTCSTKFVRPCRTIQASAGRPDGHRGQKMNVEIRRRRTKSIFVVVGLISETPSTDIDQHRDQSAL